MWLRQVEIELGPTFKTKLSLGSFLGGGFFPGELRGPERTVREDEVP